MLPVAIGSSDNPICFQVDVLYDGVSFTTEPAVTGGAAGGHAVASSEINIGRRRLVVYSEDNAVLGDGIVVEIPFNLNAGRTGGFTVVDLAEIIAAGPAGDPITPFMVATGFVEEKMKVPVFSGLTLSESGELRFTFSGIDSVTYRIEVSSDLDIWETLGTATTAEGVLEFSDPDASAYERRFYRAVEPN